jgi:hypothetical protein
MGQEYQRRNASLLSKEINFASMTKRQTCQVTDEINKQVLVDAES